MKILPNDIVEILNISSGQTIYVGYQDEIYRTRIKGLVGMRYKVEKIKDCRTEKSPGFTDYDANKFGRAILVTLKGFDDGVPNNNISNCFTIYQVCLYHRPFKNWLILLCWQILKFTGIDKLKTIHHK